MAVYLSTLDFLKQQKKNFADASLASNVLREAAVTAAPAVLNRVQQKGQKSDGSQIGQYSTKKLAFGRITNAFHDNANRKQYAKRFKNSNPGVFEGGYKQLRQELGRQVAFIDFTLSGDMFRTWRPVPISSKAYGVTFVSLKQLELANRLEQRFGTTFSLSDSEFKMSLATINANALKYLMR